MRITQIPLLALLALALTAVGAQAQGPTPVLPTAQLAFDHDGVDTERYELQIDGGAWAVTPTTSAAGVYTLPMPALTPGAHTLAVRACGPAGCSASSNAVTLWLVIIPAPPGQFRIVPTAEEW